MKKIIVLCFVFMSAPSFSAESENTDSAVNEDLSASQELDQNQSADAVEVLEKTEKIKKQKRNKKEYRTIEGGPMAQIIGFPTIFRLGAEARIIGLFGVAASYGIFPEREFNDVKVKANSYLFETKIYPFRGSFYLGAAIGRQKITAIKSYSQGIYSSDITATITSTILSPKLGWRWNIYWKAYLGLELGWQFPVGTKTEVGHSFPAAVSTSGDYIVAETKIKDEGNKIGATGLPVLGLIQFGFFF